MSLFDGDDQDIYIRDADGVLVDEDYDWGDDPWGEWDREWAIDEGPPVVDQERVAAKNVLKKNPKLFVERKKR